MEECSRNITKSSGCFSHAFQIAQSISYLMFPLEQPTELDKMHAFSYQYCFYFS